MSKTNVSVLMPIGRADRYVSPAIQSVLNQRNVNIELIAVGPADSPNGEEALRELIADEFANDSRIRYFTRTKPGIVCALNTARRHTNGDYVARMDADDIAEPMRLSEQLALSKQNDDICLVSACVTIFSETNSIQRGNQHYQEWLNTQRTSSDIRSACFVESPLPHPTWFAHKTVWDQLGHYQQGDFPEDYDMVLRAWLKRIPMIKPDALLLNWREHETRLTYTDLRYRREAFTRLKARTLAHPESELSVHEGRPIWIAGTGRNARYWHDALEDNNATVAGFVDIDRPKAKTQKRNKPVISYQQLAQQRGTDLLVTAVTAPVARKKLISWCAEQKILLGQDFILGG